MKYLLKSLGIAIFVDALAHLYAGFFIDNANPQLMIIGGVTYCILSILVYGEKKLFIYITAIIVGLGSLGTIFNYNSTGYPLYIMNVILGLDIMITCGLILFIVQRKAVTSRSVRTNQ